MGRSSRIPPIGGAANRGKLCPPLARFEGPGTEASRGATEDQLPCAVEDTRAHMVAQKMATCVKLSLAADDTGAEVTALNQTTCVTKQDKPKTKRDNDELIKVLQLNMHKSHLATAELTRRMDYKKINEKIIILAQEPSLTRKKRDCPIINSNFNTLIKITQNN